MPVRSHSSRTPSVSGERSKTLYWFWTLTKPGASGGVAAAASSRRAALKLEHPIFAHLALGDQLAEDAECLGDRCLLVR